MYHCDSRYVAAISQRNWAIVELVGLCLLVYISFQSGIIAGWGLIALLFMTSIIQSVSTTKSSYDLTLILTIPLFLGLILLFCYCVCAFYKKIWTVFNDVVRHDSDAKRILTEKEKEKQK